jgi:hypothetical protein
MSFNWIKKFGNGLSSTSDIVTPAQNASATQINIETGVPESQEQDPAGGGQYVKRAEFNGLLQALSLPLFERNGGKQVTFDADYSTQNNGYSIGTVLWCASNNTYQLSLKNNNTANFVTTPSFINDGINWQNLVNAGEFPDIIDDATTGSVTIGGRVVGGTQVIKTRDSEGRRACHQVEVSTGKARAVTWVENPDRTVNHSTYWEVNKRPYCPDLGTLSVSPFSQAYIQDCTNIFLTGVLGDGEGEYSLNMEKKRIGQNTFSISITGGIFDVTYLAALHTIQLPLSQVYYNAYGPLSGRTINNTPKIITGSTRVLTAQGGINLDFEDILGGDSGDRFKGYFSIIFTGF